MPSNENNPQMEPSNAHGSDLGQRTSSCGTRGSRNRTKWNNKPNRNIFTRKNKEINSHVFQLQVEQKHKGQYQETLDQLQVYASAAHTRDIKALKVLFTKLEQPVITVPIPTKNPTPVEDILFKEEVRQYSKDKKSLESMLVSLYNVVWGQCSKLLQNKLKASQL